MLTRVKILKFLTEATFKKRALISYFTGAISGFRGTIL